MRMIQHHDSSFTARNLGRPPAQEEDSVSGLSVLGRMLLQSGGTNWASLWILAVSLLLSLGSGAAGQPTVGPEGKRISDVQIVGNRRVRTEVILAQIHSRPGAAFNRKVADEDARRLVQMSEVYDVRCDIQESDDSVVLVFTVRESQVINAIRFEGNKKIKDKRLAEKIGIQAGNYFDQYLVRRAVEEIRRAYRDKGYYSVQVDYDAQGLELTRNLVFRIIEGPKCRIRKIRYTGNDQVPTRKLKGQVSSKWHFPIFSKGLLDDEKLEEDRLSIAAYYYAQGYLDARVFVEKRFNDLRTKATVEFVIEEGDAYHVAAIRVEGNTVFTDDEICEVLVIEEGRLLTEDRKLRSTRELERMYGAKGYLYFSVDIEESFTDREGEIIVTLRIREGRPYHLNKLIIKGNKTSQDKIIRRDFDRYAFSPGLLYDRSASDRARRRLSCTKWFDSVTIQPSGNDPNSRDALVEVEEGLTGLLTFGVGVGSNNGVSGQLSVEERNFDISNWPGSWGELFSGRSFRGGGQQLRFDFFPGTEETRGQISFSEPYLFDQPYYLNTSVYLRRRFQESYLERRRGGNLTVGRRFENQWSADVGVKVEVVQVTDLDDARVQILGKDTPDDPNDDTFERQITAPKEVEAVEGDNLLTSVTFGVGRDTTDREFRPTEGYFIRISYEQFGAFDGDHTFGKFSSGGTHFLTIFEDLQERRTVIASNFRYSTIVGDAPVFEKYYAGGIGSVRGFDFRGISPRGVNQVTDRKSSDPIGSDFLVLAGSELSHPLFEETVFGKLFVDTALIEEGSWRVGIGTGVDIMIPQLLGLVPMQFNFTLPLAKEDEDDTEVFSFTLGFRY